MTVFQFHSDYGFIPIDLAEPNILLRFFLSDLLLVSQSN